MAGWRIVRARRVREGRRGIKSVGEASNRKRIERDRVDVATAWWTEAHVVALRYVLDGAVTGTMSHSNPIVKTEMELT